MREPYGIIAKFRTAEALTAAAKKIRERGYSELDAFTPYPVESLEEPLRLNDRRIFRLTLIGGIVGLATAFAMQMFTNWDYPINVGGRATYAVSAFLVIAFELLILGAVLFAAFGMFVLNRLPRLHHPVFETHEFSRASDDRFFLLVRGSDPKFSERGTASLLKSADAISVEVLNEH